MTSDETVLLETRFKKMNMSDGELDRCLNILINSKEKSNTAYPINGCSKSEIVEMCFKKEKDDEFTFNGSISLINEGRESLENKSIEGVITFKGKRVYILTQVHRYSKCKNKDYEVGETLQFLKDKTRRTSLYQHISQAYQEEIQLLTDEKIAEYKDQFVKGLKI